MQLKLTHRIYSSGRKALCILHKEYQEIVSLETFKGDEGLEIFQVYGSGAGDDLYEYEDVDGEEKIKYLSKIFRDKDYFIAYSDIMFRLKDKRISLYDFFTKKEIRKLKLNAIEKV